MARREETGLSLEAPDDWVDRTLITYAAPPRAGETTTPTLVITRDTLKDTESIQTYADRHLLNMAGGFPEFELLSSGNRTLGEENYPAVFLRFRWRVAGGLAEQNVIFAETVGADGREVRILSTTAPADKAAEEAPRFEAVLKTVRLNNPKGTPGGGGGAPPGPPPPCLEPLAEIPMPGYPSDRRKR
jgi:hypothetical protein